MVQQYWIIGIIGLILLINILIGIHHGFVRMLYRVLSTAVAIGLAVALLTAAGSVMKEKVPLYANIEERCTAMMQAAGSSVISSGETGASQEAASGLLMETLIGDGGQLLNQMVDESGIYDALGERLATMIFYVVMFLILFVVIKVVLFVFMKALEGLAKLPVLSGINRMLGGCMGIVQGILFVWVLFLLLTVTADFSVSQDMLAVVRNAPLLRDLYNHNYILTLLQLFTIK